MLIGMHVFLQQFVFADMHDMHQSSFCFWLYKNYS